MKHLTIIIHLCYFIVITINPVKAAENPDSAYLQGNYKLAIQGYELLLQKELSATAFYNLGNAYYKIDDFARARLNYERALLLSPSDNDTRFNLKLCMQKLPVASSSTSEMFFVTIARDIRDRHSANVWAALVWSILFCSLSFWIGHRWLTPRRLSLCCRALSLLSLVLCIAAIGMGAWRHHYEQTDQRAIVLTTCEAKHSPEATSPVVCNLYAGSMVVSTNDEQNNYCRVLLPNGNYVWLPATAMAIINVAHLFNQ